MAELYLWFVMVKANDVIHRMERISLASRAPTRFGMSWVKSERENAIKVAKHLGGFHEQVVTLALNDKTTTEIAKHLHLSDAAVGHIAKVLDAHINFYKLTGDFSQYHEPTVRNWRLSERLVKTFFPHYPNVRKGVARRAMALALSGVLPRSGTLLYVLRQAIKKQPTVFPMEITDSLKSRPNNVQLVDSLRDKIQQAADRGDESAQLLLVKPDSRKSELIRGGGGLWRRHPDLVLGTTLEPSFLQDVHPKSLETRRHLINALADKGETAGIAMKHFIEGKTKEEIAKVMRLNKHHVFQTLLIGASVVFGIPPKGDRTTVFYYRLRKRHGDLFKTPKEKAA